MKWPPVIRPIGIVCNVNNSMETEVDHLANVHLAASAGALSCVS
jgi:hypothetical protein